MCYSKTAQLSYMPCLHRPTPHKFSFNNRIHLSDVLLLFPRVTFLHLYHLRSSQPLNKIDGTDIRPLSHRLPVAKLVFEEQFHYQDRGRRIEDRVATLLPVLTNVIAPDTVKVLDWRFFWPPTAVLLLRTWSSSITEIQWRSSSPIHLPETIESCKYSIYQN